MTLTESGNLLMMPGRAKDGGDWMKFAQELIDTSAVALRAAEAKDADRLLDVGGRIDQVCGRCHKKYLANYSARRFLQLPAPAPSRLGARVELDPPISTR